jgi:hypothetical protein
MKGYGNMRNLVTTGSFSRSIITSPPTVLYLRLSRIFSRARAEVDAAAATVTASDVSKRS